MDWSIHISHADQARSDLSALGTSSVKAGPKLSPVVELTKELIDECFGSISFTRCAYGNEFCEHLIPSPRQLEAVVAAARDHEMGLTFLTPYVTDAGIALLRPLFELLSINGESEVVFNDWGVLNLLRREFPC